MKYQKPRVERFGTFRELTEANPEDEALGMCFARS